MARPKEGKQQLCAYHHFSHGKKQAGAILLELEKQFGENSVSKRTVERWLQDFREVKTFLDKPFEWNQLEEYGLPWESSTYLISLWFAHKQLAGYPPSYKPTARQAIWWWRIHHAAPAVAEKDVILLAQRFVVREIGRDILGQKIDFEDLNAHLFYKPWENNVKHKAYCAAIEDGSIPALIADPDHYDTLELLSSASWENQPINRFLNSLAHSVSPDHPEQLFSQQVDAFLEQAANSEIVEHGT